MKVISSFSCKAKGNRIINKDDNFNPMNVDDASIVSIGLNYLNKVKQDLEKGKINGNVVGIVVNAKK